MVRLGLLFVASSFILAWADGTILAYPLPAFSKGEVRITKDLVYDGRNEFRKPTGETRYKLDYYSGPGEDATHLGELTFKISDSTTVRWGRIDSKEEGKGIATALYRTALAGAWFEKVAEIRTSWTDDNEKAYQRGRFEGLPSLEAAQLTPSAKTFRKLGWVLGSVDTRSDLLTVTYRRAPPSEACLGPYVSVAAK